LESHPEKGWRDSFSGEVALRGAEIFFVMFPGRRDSEIGNLMSVMVAQPGFLREPTLSNLSF
jgi:hypothetical protein